MFALVLLVSKSYWMMQRSPGGYSAYSGFASQLRSPELRKSPYNNGIYMGHKYLYILAISQ